jgi:hypothetical protein
LYPTLAPSVIGVSDDGWSGGFLDVVECVVSGWFVLYCVSVVSVWRIICSRVKADYAGLSLLERCGWIACICIMHIVSFTSHPNSPFGSSVDSWYLFVLN